VRFKKEEEGKKHGCLIWFWVVFLTVVSGDIPSLTPGHTYVSGMTIRYDIFTLFSLHESAKLFLGTSGITRGSAGLIRQESRFTAWASRESPEDQSIHASTNFQKKPFSSISHSLSPLFFVWAGDAFFMKFAL
jgi:hypothetical protein